LYQCGGTLNSRVLPKFFWGRDTEIKDINNKTEVDEIFLELGKIVVLIDESFELKNKSASIKDIKEILTWMRICIKYLKFETEAQRREIKYLIHIIERLNNDK
jgi:hypothetical protein